MAPSCFSQLGLAGHPLLLASPLPQALWLRKAAGWWTRRKSQQLPEFFNLVPAAAFRARHRGVYLPPHTSVSSSVKEGVEPNPLQAPSRPPSSKSHPVRPAAAIGLQGREASSGKPLPASEASQAARICLLRCLTSSAVFFFFPPPPAAA